MPRFNYIVTIHNKEDLIEKVLTGILVSAGANSHVYLVLDGCTDGTQAVVDRMLDETVGLPVSQLQAPDVHEILSLNIALRQIPQDGVGYNILVQDDILLSDRNFESKVLAVNEQFTNNIGVLSFRHGVNVRADPALREVAETDLIESCYGQGMSATSQALLPEHAVQRMVCLRSPECISFETIRRIGLLDEKYAPYTYDDHDYGLRCLRAGLVNVVYALKVRSRVEWGGMRRKIQPGVAAIMKRNRQYVYQDHKDFIDSLRPEDFRREPVRIEVALPAEDAQTVLQRYEANRVRLDEYNRRQRFNLIRRIREKLAV
jgi:glycosyltransferase involved in cell wall biosynthesis